MRKLGSDGCVYYLDCLDDFMVKLSGLLCSGSHKAETKVSVRSGSYLEALERFYPQAHSSNWQNSSLYGFGIEVPSSLIAVS